MKNIVRKMLVEWSYEKAVEELKPEIIDWSKRTLKVARALYVARENLRNQGARIDLLNSKSEAVTSGNIAGSPKQVFTFEQFCNEVGISVRTANYWLQCYDPDIDYLFEREEVQEMLQTEKELLFEDVRKKRLKIEGYIPEEVYLKWNRKITTWNDKLENEYLFWLYKEGYSSINPNYQIQDDFPIDKYSQFGLWSLDYLQGLADRCINQTSGNGGVRYTEMVMKYRPRIPKDIEPNKIMRIPVIVSATLSDIKDDNERKAVAKLLAEIIQEET